MDETLKALVDKGYGGWVILTILIPYCIGFTIQLSKIVSSLIIRWKEGPRPLTANERQLYNFMENQVGPMITNVNKLAEEVAFLSGRTQKG